MSMLEVHPEIKFREKHELRDYCTCFKCHRSFRARSEDQYSVQLCDSCFDVARHLQDPVVRVHVRVRPRKSPTVI